MLHYAHLFSSFPTSHAPLSQIRLPSATTPSSYHTTTPIRHLWCWIIGTFPLYIYSMVRFDSQISNMMKVDSNCKYRSILIPYFKICLIAIGRFFSKYAIERYILRNVFMIFSLMEEYIFFSEICIEYNH